MMKPETFDSLQTPPHSRDAEQSVLGGLMLDNTAIDRIGALKEDDFYQQDHRLIFRTIKELSGKGAPLDVVTMSEHLKSTGDLENAGGFSYLVTMARDTPSAASISAYSKIVADHSQARQTIKIMERAALSGYQANGKSSTDLINSAMADLKRLQSRYEPEQAAIEINPNAKAGLLNHLPDDWMFKRMVRDVAAATWMPESSVLIAALGVVSGVTSRLYSVAYPDGSPLPTSLYVVVAQPPATAKSRILSTFQKPILDIDKRERERISAEVEAWDSEKDGAPPAPPVPLYRTDATPEAIDATLKNSGGFFNIASSEQAAINSLLGQSYSTSKSGNKDLLLKGYNGENHSSARAGRDGFTGTVVGSITCFAQQGAIQNIYESSNGTGQAERFIALEEPHSLGQRDHLQTPTTDNHARGRYKIVIEKLTEAIYNGTQPEFDELPKLTIEPEAFITIQQFRNLIEPQMMDGEKYSSATLRGIAGKVDITIMKLAANLALLNEHDPDKPISHRYIIPAINITRELLERSAALVERYRLSGDDAEAEEIIDYLSEKGAKTKRQIQNAKRCTKVFEESGGDSPYKYIGTVISRMMASGVISEDSDGLIRVV